MRLTLGLGTYSVLTSTSPSRRQRELENPSAARALERPREVELADRKAEEVHAKRDARAGDAFARAAEDLRRLVAVPRDAAVGEQRHFHRNRSVHVLRDAERPEQREAELEVADEHAAADQSIERGAVARLVRHALSRVERVDVVAADERRVAHVQREEPQVFAATAVPAVV